MDMGKYYTEKQELLQLAKKMLVNMKKGNITINLSKFRLAYEDKFTCSWSAFDKRVLLVCECDPNYIYDEDTNVVSYVGPIEVEVIKEPEPVPEPVPEVEVEPEVEPEPVKELTKEEEESLAYELKRQEFYKKQEEEHGKEFDKQIKNLLNR